MHAFPEGPSFFESFVEVWPCQESVIIVQGQSQCEPGAGRLVHAAAGGAALHDGGSNTEMHHGHVQSFTSHFVKAHTHQRTLCKVLSLFPVSKVA